MKIIIKIIVADLFGETNLYKEYRASGFLETISSTSPESWGRHFHNSGGLSTYKKISLLADKRWALIKRFLKPNSLILDAGCGAGEWVEFLNSRGYSAEGLDYSKDLIQNLEKYKPQYKWMSGNIMSLPIKENTYDGIISWGVIEHHEAGPEEAIKEFCRVLKTGGFAIVTVPNDCRATRLASERMFPQQAVIESGGSFFQYYMSTAELKAFFENNGFRVHLCKSLGGPSLALVCPRVYAKVLNCAPLFRILNLIVKVVVPKLRKFDHNIICIAEKN